MPTYSLGTLMVSLLPSDLKRASGSNQVEYSPAGNLLCMYCKQAFHLFLATSSMIYLQLILDASFFFRRRKALQSSHFFLNFTRDWIIYDRLLFAASLKNALSCADEGRRTGDASCAVSFTLVLPSAYTHEAICTRASLRKALRGVLKEP